MTVECPKCKRKYNVSESLIPSGGAPVRCPDCSNIFTIYREPLDIRLEPVGEEQVSPPKEEVIPQVETIETEIEEPSVIETTVPVDESELGAELETKVPPPEERTKLWEKLQETYTPVNKQETVSPTIEEEKPETPIMEAEVIPEETPTTVEEPTMPLEEEKPETSVMETEVIPEEIPTAVEEPTVPLEEEKPETPVMEAEVIPEETPTAELDKPLTEEGKTEKEAKRLARSLVKDILLYHKDKVEIGLRQGNLAQLIGDEIRKSWRYYKDSFSLEKTGGVNYFKEALNEIIGKGKPIFK